MSYNSLNKFTKDLINNTINSAKTTDIALNISYEDFKKYNEEQKQYNAHLIEEYMKNHDLPRKEQLSTYNTYLTDKANLKSEYNKTKDTNDLINFLQFKTPESLLVQKDPIYTIYSS
jgi:ribosomal protein S4